MKLVLLMKDFGVLSEDCISEGVFNFSVGNAGVSLMKLRVSGH